MAAVTCDHLTEAKNYIAFKRICLVRHSALIVSLQIAILLHWKDFTSFVAE